MMEEQDIRAKASTLRAALAQRDEQLAAAHATIHQLGENAAKAAGEYAERVAEMRRYLPVLERAEADAAVWQAMTDGLGIATLNGYRAALTEPTDG